MSKRGTIKYLPVDRIDPNPQQPRTHFDAALLRDLAASIQTHGLIQPIIVQAETNGRYTIIVGERRWRAVKAILMWSEIQAVVIDPLNDQELLERAFAENIERADMTPSEEGYAYLRMKQSGLSVNEISRRIGRSGTHIAWRIELVTTADQSIIALIDAGKLPVDRRAVKALMGIKDPKLRGEVVEQLAITQPLIKEIVDAAKIAKELSQGDETPKENKQQKPERTRVRECEERPLGSVRSFALSSIYGDCPVPGPHSDQIETVALNACKRCPLFDDQRTAACDECAMTVFIQQTAALLEGKTV